MNITEIKELYKTHAELDGKEVYVTGWVRTIRDSKAFGFIELNDGTFFKTFKLFLHRKNWKIMPKLQHLMLVRHSA